MHGGRQNLKAFSGIRSRNPVHATHHLESKLVLENSTGVDQHRFSQPRVHAAKLGLRPAIMGNAEGDIQQQ